MTDSTGESTYTYDIQDRLISYTPAGQDEIAYEYNALNQKTSMTISGESPTTYSYYANGWLKSVSGHGLTNIATYSYDEVGNRTGIDYDSGTVTTYDYEEYDPRYRISEIAHDPVYGSTLTIEYGSRDGVGNPTEIDSVSYGYDYNSRLASVNTTTYTYDWVGNRYPSTHTYNSADELIVSPNHTYTYLDTGSLYQQKSTGGTVQKTFAYTPANLLESVTHAGVQDPSEMTWDADSNRVSFTSSTGGTWEYMHDITAGIPAVIKETGLKTYVREPDGSLIAMFVESYPYYFHFDALGSTRMLTDESGHITDSYTYDAWGNLTNHTGDTSQPYQFVGELGYYTHYQDANLPLLQLGVRFYDPGLGRFGQRDKLVVGARRSYEYCLNNPSRLVDPLGLFWCEWKTKKWHGHEIPYPSCHSGTKPKDAPGTQFPNTPYDTCKDAGDSADAARQCGEMYDHMNSEPPVPDPRLDRIRKDIGDKIDSMGAQQFQTACESWFAEREGRPSFGRQLRDWVRHWGDLNF